MVSGSWLNTDKLYLEFGPLKAANDLSGEFHTRGDRREVEITLDLANITGSTAATPSILSNALFLPSGVLIEEVQILAQSMPATVNATFNFGLINASDRTTVVASQGLVNAVTSSAGFVQGTLTVLRLGSSYAGGLIGTNTVTVPTNLTGYWGTGSTTGTIRLRVAYVATQTISS